MKLKYLGHSCFQLETAGKYIVFDPFIRGNTLASDAGIDIDEVKADYILVSHGHDDHTGDLVYLAERTGALVIACWEVYTWLAKQGYTHAHPMSIGGRWNTGFGMVKMTPAQHTSSLPDGTYGGNPAGFIIEAEGKKLYYSGDTGLSQEMKLIGELNRPDIALLSLGDNFTMGYEDAALAAGFLNCDRIVGMHYDTFGYIVVNHEAAVEHFRSKGKNLTLMPIGGTMEL
jgi:L-ascorbate metabolism protein UlaG (beta-lactamase superfamily)